MSNQAQPIDPIGARETLETPNGPVTIYRITRLEEEGIGNVSRLPYSMKIMLAAALRQLDNFEITRDDVVNLATWARPGEQEIPYKPASVILQDFTGVPSVVDLAALRSARARLDGAPTRINPVGLVALGIGNSVPVDQSGSALALMYNAERESERNRERYEFLRWGQDAFANFRIVPPATGIVHQ